MNTASLLAFAALPWLFAAPAATQVVISEINFSAQDEDDDQWIELVNLGGEAVELNGWSLYLATGTPGGASNYWFAIPDTELDPSEFLRVHWLAPIPPVSPGENEIYTGTGIANFMFGYFAEPLPTSGGALAVLTTQNNLLMNTPAIIEDWVSWGGTGYPREDLAVQAVKWSLDETVEAPQQLDSIAQNLDLEPLPGTAPTPVGAYFHDASPTPNAANATGGSVARFGVPCAGTNLVLQAESFPVPGNRDFKLRLDNTLGLPDDRAILVLSLNPGDGSLVVAGCQIWVDILPPAAALLIPAETGLTPFDDFDLSFVRPALAGIEFDFQGAVFNLVTGALETTDALQVTLGN